MTPGYTLINMTKMITTCIVFVINLVTELFQLLTRSTFDIPLTVSDSSPRVMFVFLNIKQFALSGTMHT